MSSYYDDDDEIDIRVRRAGLSRPQRVEHRRPAEIVPPIYPARPIRRASTLPVRFADEEIIEREISYPENESRPGYFRRDDVTPSQSRAEPGLYDSNSDEERGLRVRRRDSYADDREPEGARERSWQRYHTHRSPSPSHPSPFIINNRIGRESSDSPISSVDLDYERGVSRRTLQGLRQEKEVRFGPDHGIYEDDREWEKDAYSFRLSRHSKSLFSRDSNFGSVSDASEDNESSPGIPKSEVRPPQQGKVLQIFRSKYTGEGVIGGLQSAELTLMDDDASQSRRGPHPVFRWIQFEDPTMNFDRFETGCQTITGLTETQQTGISRVISRVRRRADKPIQVSGGRKARFMVPGVLQDIIPKELGSSNANSKTITWMCLPYFCLQSYSGNYSGLHAASHPIRTLLQTRFSLAKKERDMQQAVCHLLGTPQDHCFHIAQVWCLVLDEDLLVTCSGTPIPTLVGKHISLSQISLPIAQPSYRRRQTHLLVSSAHLVWSLPLDECQSWFAFVSHFWEFWPRRLEFLVDGKAVTPGMWQKTIDRASRSLVRLYVDTRPTPREHARGFLIFSAPRKLDSNDVPNQSNDFKEKTETEKSPTQESGKTEQGVSDKTGITTPKERKVDDQSSLHPKIGKPNQTSVKARSDDTLGSSFHVFTWLNEEQPKTWQTTSQSNKPQSDAEKENNGLNLPFSLDEASMTMDLEEIDSFLRDEIGFQERLAYKECPESSRANIYDILQKELDEITSDDQSNIKQRRKYEEKVDLVNKAEILFQFFLPPGYEGPTVGKFWGAVSQLLAAMSAPPLPRRSSHHRNIKPDFRFFLRCLSYATPIPLLFRGFLSTTDSSERSGIEIPEEFPKAWLHLLMTFVICANEKLTTLFEEQNRICNQLMDDGMRKVVVSLKQKSLLEYAIFRPGEMASLVNFVLLGDITPQSLDTSDTYFEYLSSLESAIEASPLDRSHQDKITLFKQEISVILETLEQQQRILDFTRMGTGGLLQSSDIFRNNAFEPRHRSQLEPSYLEDPYVSRTRSRSRSQAASYVGRSRAAPRVPGTMISQIDATDPTGIQGLLIQDSQALIDRKIREFQEINTRATELETWNIQKIDYNKDRQEAAIYAFTIVTIVFLPISAVAGILGMNVNDIRNMELNQWVFWAVSLPLALIIIVLCLIWAGELENFWNGFRNLWKKGKPYSGGRAGYATLASATITRDRDRDRDRPVPIYDHYPASDDGEEYGFSQRVAPIVYRPLYGRSRSRRASTFVE